MKYTHQNLSNGISHIDMKQRYFSFGENVHSWQECIDSLAMFSWEFSLTLLLLLSFFSFFFSQVRAGESLMKLVSDMKEFLILNDFPSVNTSISERSNAVQEIINQTDQQLLTLKQELAFNLFELEQSYYSSSYR